MVVKFLNNVLRHELVRHGGAPIAGYKLAHQGCDFLALRVLLARGHLAALGNPVGVGKESDTFPAQVPGGDTVVPKFHRPGRVSYRAAGPKRGHPQHRVAASWLCPSRLSATKEFAFMWALSTRGFPTSGVCPVPHVPAAYLLPRPPCTTRSFHLHLPRVLGGVALWILVLCWDRSPVGPTGSRLPQFFHFSTSTLGREWSALTQHSYSAIFTHP